MSHLHLASCLTATVVRTATPTPVGRLAIGEQRKAGSVDSSVMSSISSPMGGPGERRGERWRRGRLHPDVPSLQEGLGEKGEGHWKWMVGYHHEQELFVAEISTLPH